MNIIKGIQKTTLVDYPETVACTIFLGGCNFKCGYCHNSDLVFRPNEVEGIPTGDFLSFLETRKRLLDGVCITGGEPTLHRELVHLCERIKLLGFRVKLDTNGSNPEMLRLLIESRLVDYIAMDVKSGLESYGRVIGVETNLENIKKSIELIRSSGISHEFRTTIVPDIINEAEIGKIGELVKGENKYFLQQFRPSKNTVDRKYNVMEPLPGEKLSEFGKIMEGYVQEVGIRNLN